MDLTNETKNQHFLSQIEQRLNAISPGTTKEPPKIYSFSITDRENHSIQLDSEKGSIIKSNLSFVDLFSFDVVDKSIRYNFESLFSRYEKDIETNTKSLLAKLANNPSEDVKGEAFNIFVAKYLNLLRNPYSIKKVLNTIGNINKFYPTDPVLLDSYKRLKEGNRPHQQDTCSRFGVSESDYESWLHALFMMLCPELNRRNPLEDMAKQLFEQDSHFVMVTIFHYTGEHADKRCLLSDRGYSDPSPEDEASLFFTFNLCSSAFIGYAFVDIQKSSRVRTLNPLTIDFYKHLPKVPHVDYKENVLDALAAYNCNVMCQSHSKVYSSSKTVFGAKNHINNNS
jgi:hypothetical protein